MLSRNTLSSKRAKILVALCENAPSPASSELSTTASCFTLFVAAPGWDNIFEASDIPRNVTSAVKHLNAVKRKLFSSPAKELCIGRTEECRFVTNECGPITSNAFDIIECSANGDIDVPPRVDTCNEADTAVSDEKNSLAVGPHEEPAEEPQLYPSIKKILAAKCALNAGKEHITIQGRQRRARFLKSPCLESCKRCSRPKLLTSDREKINSEFWSLKDHTKQWAYIQSLVICTIPKTKSCIPGAVGEKTSSRIYQFSVNGTPKRVCKIMFKNTLDICDSWINSAISHFSNGEMTCDKRGRKTRHN